jgi:hypothetical protein
VRIDSNTLAFLNVLRRGAAVDIHAESVSYLTSTEILDSEPDDEGGVVLTLDATIEDGQLLVTEAMVASAEHDGDGWYIRHGGLVFRFWFAESEPALGPDRFFTRNPGGLCLWSVERARRRAGFVWAAASSALRRGVYAEQRTGRAHCARRQSVRRSQSLP